MIDAVALLLFGIVLGILPAAWAWRRFKRFEALRARVSIPTDDLLCEFVCAGFEYGRILEAVRSCHSSGAMTSDSAIRFLPLVTAALEANPGLASSYADWVEKYVEGLAVPQAVNELRMALQSDVRVSTDKLLNESVVESTTETVDNSEDYSYGGSFGEEEGTKVTTTVYEVDVVSRTYEAYNPLARVAHQTLLQLADADPNFRPIVGKLTRGCEGQQPQTVEIRERRRGAELGSTTRTYVTRHESSVR